MNREKALELIVKYTEHTASAAEKQLLEQYFIKYLENKDQLPDHVTIESANLDIWNNLQVHIAGSTKKPAVIIKLWQRIAVAVSLIFVLSLGLFFGVRYLNNRNERVLVVNAIDVSPGKNVARLSMEDGTTVELSEAKSGVVIAASSVKYNDGSVIGTQIPAALMENSMLTATTPRGGTYQITLADGTHVWLNAGSSLKFPSQFIGKERRVELSGEAYFEVAKVMIEDRGMKHKTQRMPFVVVTDQQQVQVLGTHFNINSYADEANTKTTLLEGLVHVALNGGPTLNEGTNGIHLLPNQQAISTTAGIKVKQVNVEEAVAWKNGYFDFNEEKLESIMNKISRWYDVTVVYENPALKEQIFTGNISKFNNVSTVLKKIALTDVLRFKIDGKKIIVTD